MSLNSPAGKLREAAQRLGGLIDAATKEPWTLVAGPYEDDTICGAEGETVIAPQDEQGGPSWHNDADAAYIIAMDPGVGRIAVQMLTREADALDADLAARVRDFGPERGPDFVRNPDPLLKELADRILGGEGQ